MTGPTKLTRRGLLRGFGAAPVIASCAGPSSGEVAAEAVSPADPLIDAVAIGPGLAPLDLRLNGAARTVEAAPQATLLALLRDQLAITGTKEVCDRGACGACNVLVDGEVRSACMTLAHDVAGREVTTVEGLATSGAPSPLQRAFVELDALQCGYCTSGMLISCSALLSRARGPLSRAQIQGAIAGNLCRCGCYEQVIAAVQSAAGERSAL
jgi:xanthine dehydrogenase YagT iron-sulfur-binding subunit